MVCLFDDLSDLSLIEIFSYLSCIDAVWSFSNLNVRLTALLIEQGFYCNVNLSSTRYHQFQTVLFLLRLNEIQSLVIDSYASSLQLRKWPYLPKLAKLQLKGVRDFIDVFNFAKQHANTLTHLTVESSEYSCTDGITKDVCYPLWNLCEFTKKIVRHLRALHLLDLGMETSSFVHHWPLKTIPTSLTYLKITLTVTRDLFNIMKTKPLSDTLQQLHVKMPDMCGDINRSLRDRHFSPRMESLHTFTFVKSFKLDSDNEWTFVNVLTTSNIMPVLRRMNFSIVIKVNDLDRMSHSALFTDYRHVDVHYAFIISDNRLHSELDEYVPRGSQSHPRKIASATFISERWSTGHTIVTPDLIYFNKDKNRQHLFYTLPWIFGEFSQLCVPDKYINELQTFALSSPVNTVGLSRLVKLEISDNIPSSTICFPHIMSSNQIVELHLIRCDRQISVNLPNLSHLILTNSLDSLNSCSLSRNIRSIQITLHYERVLYTFNDWTAFRTLSTLPFLNSLRILLCGMHNPPNDTSCQIIAETASAVSDFSFCFRRSYHQHVYNVDLAYTKHALFIKQLRNHILTLPLNEEPCIVVQKDGCGLFIWF